MHPVPGEEFTGKENHCSNIFSKLKFKISRKGAVPTVYYDLKVLF
jgi:hypothetical protein